MQANQAQDCNSVSHYYGVSIEPQNVIGVVTQKYFDLIQVTECPKFYSEFKYLPLTSPLSLTELNQLTPFTIDPEGQINHASHSHLSEKELTYMELHRRVLQVYSENNLPPMPPWEILNCKPCVINSFPQMLKLLIDFQNSQ